MGLNFDTNTFLRDHFRDPDGVVGQVNKHFRDAPNKEAVRKWFARRAIPADWWPVLLAVVEEENGTPVTLRGYFTEGAREIDIFG